MSDHERYRFSPLERRGLLLGLGPAQLAIVGTGVVGALLELRSAPGGAGLVAGMGTVALAVALACWPVAGRTAVGWAPVVARWCVAGRRRPATWNPDRSLAPAGVYLLAAPVNVGEDPLGVLRDTRTGAWSAALRVGCGSFTLLDVEDKQRRLGAWGAILVSAARAGSPIHRLQWVERTRAGDSDALDGYLRANAPAATDGCEPTGPPAAMLASYREVVAAAGRVDQAHEVLVVVSVHPRRASRQTRAFGRGPQATCALLRRELRLLQGQLRGAEMQPGRPLDVGQLAAALRAATDPSHLATDGASDSGAWPMAVEERWASVHIDDRWHATYWIAEWPRLEVGPDFLTPLLLVGGARTVSLTMAPVPPARAIREVESARTADLADAELRRRAGFLSTARHRRTAEGALHREAELADGHGDYRFCGYVSVSASDPRDLDGVCAELEQAAQQSHLDLRRLYGQQHDALTWTMPLARGLG